MPASASSTDNSLGNDTSAETLSVTERLSRIAALHQPITDGPNEGFCDGCESAWPCPTRLLSHPAPGSADLDAPVGAVQRVVATIEEHSRCGLVNPDSTDPVRFTCGTTVPRSANLTVADRAHVATAIANTLDPAPAANVHVEECDEYRVTYPGNDYEDLFTDADEVAQWVTQWKSPITHHRRVRVTTEQTDWQPYTPKPSQTGDEAGRGRNADA